MFATSHGWGVGEVVLAMLYFTFLFIWIWLAISVFIDIFRSRDMGGLHKAVWVVAIIAFNLLGVLAYLIVRGGKMHEHEIEAAKAQDAAMQNYIRNAAGTTPADVNRLLKQYQQMEGMMAKLSRGGMKGMMRGMKGMLGGGFPGGFGGR